MYKKDILKKYYQAMSYTTECHFLALCVDMYARRLTLGDGEGKVELVFLAPLHPCALEIADSGSSLRKVHYKVSPWRRSYLENNSSMQLFFPTLPKTALYSKLW